MFFSVEFALLYLQSRIVILPVLLVSLLLFPFQIAVCERPGKLFLCIYLETCTTAKILGQMWCPEQLVTPKIDVLD